MSYENECYNEAADFVLEYILDEMIQDIAHGVGVTQRSAQRMLDRADQSLSEYFCLDLYDVRDCIDLLNDLEDWEETDSGLWEGTQGWRDTIRAIAAYTYSNAGRVFVSRIVEILVDYADQVRDEAMADHREEHNIPEHEEDPDEIDECFVEERMKEILKGLRK